jgi:hypothetical protein
MGGPPQRAPVKKDVVLELLETTGVFLHLDPRREGVVVPPHFKKQPELVLQVGLNMPVPIRDLQVDDDGVHCTLSFNRSPFWCSMPWPSIFAVRSDLDARGFVWPADVPPESSIGRAAAAPKRPALRAVSPDEPAPEPEPEPEPEEREVPEGAGSCKSCGTRWGEDQDACVLCGESRARAFRPDGEADAPAPKAKLPMSIAFVTEEMMVDAPAEEPAPPVSEEAPPDEEPVKGKRPLPPYLRIVK